MQVLPLSMANLHDCDSGDQHLHHPVYMHGAHMGARCSEGL